ncbi:MAG: glycosyltransferase family 1 protein [Acetivibrionales bacterium]|jgi:glycosyltransferase involved in cell wall biosynthesis
MVRILHILNSMNRGGVETTLMNIFRLIDRDKVMFDFLLHTDKECAYNDEIRSLGGRIYNIPSRRESVIKNIKEAKSFISEHPEYKIIHMHVGSLSYIAPLIIARKMGVPFRIIHSRNTQEGGSRLHKYIHRINRLNIDKYATHYFACSDLAAKWFYGDKKLNIQIISNGIIAEKFVYDEYVRRKVREQFNISNKLVIGNVGRFHPQKNHLYLIDIFNEITKYEKNSVLMLIGDGANRGIIEDKITNLGLRDKVIITGYRSDIHELLQAFDAFVMPSLHEGLPGSVIEAQGAGLPCFLSDTITKQVAVTDLVHFISIKNPPSYWCEKILDVISTTERKNTKAEIINAGFDMRHIAKHLQNIYLEMINTQ